VEKSEIGVNLRSSAVNEVEKTKPMLKWEKRHKDIYSKDLWGFRWIWVVLSDEKQSQSKPISNETRFLMRKD